MMKQGHLHLMTAHDTATIFQFIGMNAVVMRGQYIILATNIKGVIMSGLQQRYDIYLTFADNGAGGDITRNGSPLLTFDQWLNS